MRGGRWGGAGGSGAAPGARLTRRDFLRAGLVGGAGAAALLTTGRLHGSPRPRSGPSYGFLVDLTKCIGCGACVRACAAENEVPAGFFRTWIERYTVLRDGRVLVDSPEGAFNGFAGDPPLGGDVARSYFVPKLCNHCEDSPCVQVCPVGASYVSPEGVVLVDRKHCVGCGYCVQACPYGCRYISPKGYADKCTFCYHRVAKGLKPACVAACPVGARVFGDLAQPASPVRRIMDVSRYGVLKAHLGTHPKCFYVGLGQEVI
ncbi:MAG TPA: 4Fe-4S dicluster domain-containing protein [Polyangia bacterium]|jgi:Fe-S-cluster-containing dehydrogenase component